MIFTVLRILAVLIIVFGAVAAWDKWDKYRKRKTKNAVVKDKRKVLEAKKEVLNDVAENLGLTTEIDKVEQTIEASSAAIGNIEHPSKDEENNEKG